MRLYCKKRGQTTNCQALHKEKPARSVALVKTSCPVSEVAPMSCESELEVGVPFLMEGFVSLTGEGEQFQ